jgi:hypothetical protein
MRRGEEHRTALLIREEEERSDERLEEILMMSSHVVPKSGCAGADRITDTRSDSRVSQGAAVLRCIHCVSAGRQRFRSDQAVT